MRQVFCQVNRQRNRLSQPATTDYRQSHQRSSIRPTRGQHAVHGGQRFFADVMLDTFTVDRRGLGTDAKLAKKGLHDLMPFTRLRCQSPPRGRQFNGLIRCCRHQAVSLESLDRVIDSCVRDCKVSDQIDGPTGAMLTDRRGYRFDIIFGNFTGMIVSSSLMNSGGQFRDRFTSAGQLDGVGSNQESSIRWSIVT